MLTLSNAQLTDAHWEKIYAFLQMQEAIHWGQEAACRRFVEAVLWILRSGAQWRLLSPEQGRWNSVYRRFRRWGRHRIWEKMFDFFCHDEDLKKLIGDSTVVRPHACAAGALAPGQVFPVPQQLGRSKGGFSTKIHLLISGHGKPQRVILTPGQAGDAPQIPHLLDQLFPRFGIFDKAYDTNNVLEYFESHDITPVIPPKVNRVVQREYDKELYKERNLIERFIGKIK